MSEDCRLYWEGSKTLYEACKHLSTKGFIAAELFESRVRELEAERDRLKEALRKGTSKWVIDTIDMLDAENDSLRARLERLVKSAKWAKAYLDGIEHEQNYPKKTFDNFLNEFELSLEAAQDAR